MCQNDVFQQVNSLQEGTISAIKHIGKRIKKKKEKSFHDYLVVSPSGRCFKYAILCFIH